MYHFAFYLLSGLDLGGGQGVGYSAIFTVKCSIDILQISVEGGIIDEVRHLLMLNLK